MKRQIVLPGSAVGDVSNKMPGRGTFKVGTTIYASRLGIVNDAGKHIDIIPLSGVYNPCSGDIIIGVVKEVLRSAWLVDINAPYPAFLNVENVPWRVEYGETAKYLQAGDVVIVTITSVDETKSIDISMKCRSCRKVEDGLIISVQPSKVARMIGKNSSMLSVLKKYTNCWIFIGQNGRVWVKGDTCNVTLLTEAIRKIETDAHTVGLTQKITDMLGGD